MNWQWLYWVLPHVALAAALVYSLVVIRARLSSYTGNIIAVMMIGGIAWLAADALEYSTISISGKIQWDHVQHAIMALLPFGYTLFAAQRRRFDRVLTAVTGFTGLAFAAIFLLDGSLNWRWMTADAWLVSAGGNQWLQPLRLPLFYLFIGWVILSCSWTSLRLVVSLRHNPTGAPYQAINLIAVALLTLVTAGLDLSRLSPWPFYRFSSLVYSSLALGVAWNLVRMRESDEQIALRWTALEEMADPYLVLDRLGIIVDANQAALQMIGTGRDQVLRRALKHAWPELEEGIAQAAAAQPSLASGQAWEVLVNLQQGPVNRRYRVRRSELQDSPGLPFRALLTLRASDTTDELEPQLSRIAKELGSSHYITEAMLSLERMPVVMDRVAHALVSNLDLDAVWVARIHDAGHSLSWLAFRHQLGNRLAADLIDVIGGDPRKHTLSSKLFDLPTGAGSAYQRLLHGETVIDRPLLAYLVPWCPVPYCEKVLQRSGLSAACAVPVEAAGRVLGFILAATRSGMLTPYQRESLRRTAAQAAVVLENHRLQEQQNERAEEIERSRTMLAALGQVAALLPASANPEEIMSAVGTGLRRLNLTCYFADYIKNEGGLRMRYLSVHPQTLAAAEKLAGLSRRTYRLPEALGPLAPVLKHHQPMYIEDMHAFSGEFLPMISPSIARQVYRLVGVAPGTPGAYLPIPLDSERVGVFGVWGSDLRQDDLLALEIFASQVSTALRSGRLLEQEQKRAESADHTNALLAALSQAAAELPLTTTAQEVMSTVGSQLRRLGLTCYFGELDPGGRLRIPYINFEEGFLQKVERLARVTRRSYSVSADIHPLKDVLRHEKPTYIPDGSSLFSAFLPGAPVGLARRVWEMLGIRPGVAAAYAPLKVDGSVAGLIGVWGEDLRPEDLPPITIFAAQVSSALKFVNLYEHGQQRALELRRSNERIAELGRIAVKLRSALQPDEVLKILGVELHALGMECYVAEKHPDGSGLYVRYMSVDLGVLRMMERAAEMTLQRVRLKEDIYPAKDVLDGETLFIENLLDLLSTYLTFLPRRLVLPVVELAGVSPASHAVWMPLRTPEGVQGILAIWGENLWEGDIPALSVFGNQVGVALEYARLHAEITHQLRRQTLLRQASDAWHGSLDMADVLRQVARQFGAALDVTSVYICCYDPDTGATRVLADYISEHATGVEQASDVGESYYFYLQTDQRLDQGVIQYDWDDVHLSEVERRHLQEFGCQTVVIVPLEVRGRVAYFAELWETRSRRLFTGDELDLCRDLADTASTVVDNAHLYAELQQRLQERSAVMNAADVVLASQDLSEVTTRLAETLGKAIDATSAYFIFYNTDERSYAVIAEYIGPAATEQEHESDLGMPYYDDASELMFMLLQGVPVVQHSGQWKLNPEYQAHLDRFGVQSVMFLPLIQANTGLIGYIEVWETRSRREFSPAELRLCQAIAQQASIAIEKSRLYVTAQREIREREQVEARLRQSEQEYRRLFENAHDGILLFDITDGRIQEANPHACEMYGFTRQELLGKELMEISQDPAAEQRQWESALVENGSLHLRTVHRRRDGVEMYLEVTGAPMVYGGRQVMQCILRDITERVRAEERLRYDAFHDGLTSLPNRALFLERLERACARYRRDARHGFAVLFLDLDQFKKVNDTRGHFLGDNLLVQVARRLESCVRAVDTVARLGGDEFVILMEDIREILDAGALCERILIHFRQPFYLESEPIYTSMSIGVVMSEAAYNTTEAYLRDADIAMYRAKAAGRNRFEVFDAEMRDQVIKRLELEYDLRQAIELEHFQVFYMPIVDLRSSRVVGFEALLRWNHPQRGLVPPIHFIPIAEETGLILPLGEWVLRQACRQMRLWQEKYNLEAQIAVNVNISGVQLAQSDLVEIVRSVLAETGLPPRCLCLEVTESALIHDIERTLGIITGLKSMGVSVQLDDFGTGYSALSYLRQFPIDAIKIDRSFMSVRDGSRRGPDLIRTMVLMGHELGIQVVAEGVETGDQLEYLLSVSCAYGQGFLFARPLQAQFAEDYLIENLRPSGTQENQ